MKKNKWSLGIVVGLIIGLVSFHAWGVELVFSGTMGLAAGGAAAASGSLVPVAGPVGGVLYGVMQAGEHARKDVRQWTKNPSHRMIIRSWILDLSRRGTTIPVISKPGFCSAQAAMTWAARTHRDLRPAVRPSPMPCTHVFGNGAFGTPR